MEFFTRVSAQIRDFLNSLSASRKMALGVTGSVILLFLGGIFYWASNQGYQPITNGALSPDDSANIMRLLREKKIPFQVDPTGKSITVPPEYLNDLRLELAMQGMPQNSGGTGYELFDKQSFGTTSFLNKINQKRAQEGELMRSINTIKGVKHSRVHLALPEKSAFVEDQKKPTASVVLDLEPGHQLNEKQVHGITHLVASAIDGLDAANVVIVDSMGKELSKNTRDSLVALTGEQAEYKRKLEEDYQRRTEELLAKVVGEGHIKVAVSAELDFSTVSEQQTILDQDGATIRSKQSTSESAEGTHPVGGAPGAASNTPGEQPGVVTGNQAKTNTAHNNEIVNYEIPKTVRTTQKPTGNVKKLSVAVLVDSKQVHSVNADGKSENKPEAWSAEKVKEFEAIIIGALALDKKRGDTLEVRNMDFVPEDFEEAQRLLDSTATRGYIQSLIVYGVIGLVILLFFFFVVRPYIRWITENTTDSVDSFLPQTIEELEKIQKSSTLAALDEVVPDLPDRLDPDKVEGEMIREKIVTLIDNNPHKASLVLKEWLVAKPKDERTEKSSSATA